MDEAKVALTNAYVGLKSIQIPLGRERSLVTVVETIGRRNG